MRRLFALLLIATSGWLLHQTLGHNFGGVGHSFWSELANQADKPAFLVPAVGGFLCMVGGLIVFFNGAGGAALAMIGGLAVAGFTLTLKQTFDLDHILDSELAVGATMLMLAAMTASTTRVSPRSRKAAAREASERIHSSGRRIY